MGLPALNVTAEGSLAFGLVLSGMPIGGADYFDSVATIFDQASADPSESLGDVYRRTATFYRNDVRAQPGESRVTTLSI